MKLKVHLENPKTKVDPNTDIFLVNSYGKTKSFYKNCKNVFLGGSMIKHGGQNPLEAVRYGCNILHGPNVDNFREIYDFLKKKKISIKINKQKELIDTLTNFLSNQKRSKKKYFEFRKIGQGILIKTFEEIKL